MEISGLGPKVPLLGDSKYLHVKQGFLHNITHTLTLLECHVDDLSKFASLWR